MHQNLTWISTRIPVPVAIFFPYHFGKHYGRSQIPFRSTDLSRTMLRKRWNFRNMLQKPEHFSRLWSRNLKISGTCCWNLKIYETCSWNRKNLIEFPVCRPSSGEGQHSGTATEATPQHHLQSQGEDGVEDNRAQCGGFRLTWAGTAATGTTGSGTGSCYQGLALWGQPWRGGCWCTGTRLWTGLTGSIDTVSVLEPISRVKNLSAWAITL